MVATNSTLFPPDKFDLTTDHEEQPSPTLSVVGNAKKYSITQTNAKHQQAAISTQRSIFHSRRDYGEVYVRHKVPSQMLNLPFESRWLFLACRYC